ncbi:unnamed protein product [Adineta steineri]|uniref:Tubby C-terminal domain-containing protein n=1 Tax=Adineta steineri TaxID=433720 RepID=A0A815IVY4_9BILA|nr:unnamed protein product [Adineta steineri]
MYHSDHEDETIVSSTSKHSKSSRSCSPIILQKQDKILENNIVQQRTACSNSMSLYNLKSFDNILHLLENDPYKFIFIPIPKQNKNYTRCRVIRVELISSNVLGAKYILYDLNGDEHQELATILYESNFLGLKGPRKLDVFLPKLDHQLQPLLKQDEIEEYDSIEQNDSCVRLYNTIPVWDEEAETYVIYFDGNSRITLPIVKKFSNGHCK